MTHTERMEDLVVAERAAEWLQRLEHGGPEVNAEFARWLRESPRHVREVLLASAIRHALKGLSSVRLSTVAEIRAKAEDSVVELDLPAPHPRTMDRGRKWWGQFMSIALGWRQHSDHGGWRLATAFAFVALLSFTAIAIYAVSDRSITTAAGEWRNLDLDDGSVLRMGPRTKVRVEMSDRRRLIWLAHGEVMAQVAGDRTRPFYIETDVATARAVGTAFAMRLVEPRRASVTVQEGIVAVARGRAPPSDHSPLGAVKVSAGEGITVSTDDRTLIPHPIDVQKDLAWVEQKLILGTSGTIADAVRELNLRNRTQIKLLDGQLGERPLRGVFTLSQPSAFVETLERSLPIAVLRKNDTLLLTTRPDAESEANR